MTKVRLSKLDAARRQLHVAIRMYFNEGDVVAMHTLTAAAFALVQNMLDAKGSKESPTQWINAAIRPEYRKRCWKALHQTANFLKHADKDSEKFHEFAPEETENLLFMAAYHYRLLTMDDTPETRLMVNWYFMKYPDIVDSAHASRLIQIKKLIGDDRHLYWKQAMSAIQAQPC